MTNHPAQLVQEPSEPVRDRGVGEQIALNRRAVAFADDVSHHGSTNAVAWSRRGVLQRLHRTHLRRVA